MRPTDLWELRMYAALALSLLFSMKDGTGYLALAAGWSLFAILAAFLSWKIDK